MTVRPAPRPADFPVATAADPLAVRRAALWALLAAKLIAGWGVRWDIQWHVLIGRDSFWIAPHLMTYTGVTLVVLLSFGVLGWETLRWRRVPGPGAPATVGVLGLVGPPGFHVAAWGVLVTVLAAPIDDLWHRLFGLDITIWSPPHLMGFLGGVVNSVGCLLIAREVYPAGSHARLLALVVAGAWLYGSLHFTVEPAMLVAYRHGGVWFHAYAMLAALLLPLALVTTARLSGHRAAPVLMLALLVVADHGGQQIARAGFALLQPVSVIEEAIAQDPTSPIALANAIARKNGPASATTAARGALLALIPVAVMAALDPRRRSVAASLGYAVALFAVFGWMLGRSPAFQPMVPGVAETGLALALTVAAAVPGALAGRRLSDFLARWGPGATS